MSNSEEFTFCPGNLSFQEVIHFIFNKQSEDGEILPVRIRDLETATLPPEEHSESLLTKYAPRQEVYDAIDLYASSEVAERLKTELKQSYPHSKFGNEFPFEEALNKICQTRVL